MKQVETTAPTEPAHSAVSADIAPGVAEPSYRRLPWIMPHVIRSADPLRGGTAGPGPRWRSGAGNQRPHQRSLASHPVRVLELIGWQYLVAPQGETQWVRNLRVQRRGCLRLGGAVTDFHAEELSDQDKVPVLRSYFRRWWSQTARLTTLSAPDAPDAEVMRAAPLHPAFRLIGTGMQQAKES